MKDIQFVDGDKQSSGVKSKVIINEREEFFALIDRAKEIVKGESPRAKVLIYVAAIERVVEDLLRNAMVPSNQKEDSILNNSVNTFESRIDLAFRIGVISHNMWRDLHVLRELRQDCEARMESFSFEHTAIQSSVAMLERNMGRQTFAGLPVSKMDTEDKFALIARTFLVTLEQSKERNMRIADAKIEKIYRDN